MKRTFLIFILFLSVMIVNAQSQDTWVVIERCISLETDQPTNWTFDGTILFASDQQLIGYSYNEDLLRTAVIQSSNIRGYGIPSPDHLWYALLEGSSEVDGLVTRVSTTEIKVYSTMDDTVYSIPWENTYGAMRRVYGHRLYWLDNMHLLYSKGGDNEVWYIINPFTGEVVLWDKWFDPHHFVFELAPNAQSGISADWPYPQLTIYTDGKTITVPDRTSFTAIWHPSSEYFIALSDGQDSTGMINLLMFDTSGEIEHVIYQTSARPNYISDPSQMLWSNDGRYLVFMDENLYIADLKLQEIIDTCLMAGNYSPMAWSPDNKQLAITDSNNHVNIIDLDQQVGYVISDKNGLIIGWRVDAEK